MGLVVERAAEHAVLFYAHDAELVDLATDRLNRGLAAGATAIVIATPEHRRAFAERTRQPGRLIALDATETLDLLAPGGTFAPDVFDEVVGALVRTAADEGPVEAFGEMVALLWQDGLVQTAIDLETAWDALIHETGASLLCAYPSALVDDPAQRDAVDQVRALHSTVTRDGALERTWRFPADRTAVTAARHVLTEVLKGQGVTGQPLEDAQIVLTELAANAVRHAGSAFSVHLVLDPVRVHLRVGDASADLPTVRPLGFEAPDGRGLHLLAALAKRWGVEPLGRGKVVWAELAR